MTVLIGLRQAGCEIVNKLANKGWSSNQRILELSEKYIQYYTKIPADFDKTKAIDNQSPKVQVQLQEIKLVGPTDSIDK